MRKFSTKPGVCVCVYIQKTNEVECILKAVATSISTLIVQSNIFRVFDVNDVKILMQSCY